MLSFSEWIANLPRFLSLFLSPINNPPPPDPPLPFVPLFVPFSSWGQKASKTNKRGDYRDCCECMWRRRTADLRSNDCLPCPCPALPCRAPPALPMYSTIQTDLPYSSLDPACNRPAKARCQAHMHACTHMHGQKKVRFCSTDPHPFLPRTWERERKRKREERERERKNSSDCSPGPFFFLSFFFFGLLSHGIPKASNKNPLTPSKTREQPPPSPLLLHGLMMCARTVPAKQSKRFRPILMSSLPLHPALPPSGRFISVSDR